MIQAIILGGLVFVVTFCTCFCLAMPVVVVTAIFEVDDHRTLSDWNHSAIVFMAIMILSLYAGLRIGWWVGRDWYRADVGFTLPGVALRSTPGYHPPPFQG
ncbi:MAG: hypothetical protein K8U57_29725 [Planctomycetes bacterium]|nr:hypothetical protein [Planctomycetota bacterium]